VNLRAVRRQGRRALAAPRVRPRISETVEDLAHRGVSADAVPHHFPYGSTPSYGAPLDERAAAEHRTASEVIRDALRQYLKAS
jgi:Ribbon-helix-helix protein, copG family